jgi:hypothetical protein
VTNFLDKPLTEKQASDIVAIPIEWLRARGIKNGSTVREVLEAAKGYERFNDEHVRMQRLRAERE